MNMTDPINWRQLCAELLAKYEKLSGALEKVQDWDSTRVGDALNELEPVIEQVSAALAAQPPEPDVDDILRLAKVICKVDGKHDKGAAALAEAILSHPDTGLVFAAQPQGAGDVSDEAAEPLTLMKNLSLDGITPPREKIIEWAAMAPKQGNPSTYMRQCYCDYGAQQGALRMYEALMSRLRDAP